MSIGMKMKKRIMEELAKIKRAPPFYLKGHPSKNLAQIPLNCNGIVMKSIIKRHQSIKKAELKCKNELMFKSLDPEMRLHSFARGCFQDLNS